MSEGKKGYKHDVEKLIARYIERLENHMQGKKQLLSTSESIQFLHEQGEYPYAHKMDIEEYNSIMEALQIELVKMQYWLEKSGNKVIVLFEGRDAAGKGGLIQRFMMNLNARHARISALDVPTDYERGQWYFQRYVKNLPSSGEFVCSDRSWYNRAGVEHVMGYCTEEQYHVFMKQVVPFEEMLVESGIILVKYWLSINQVEQLRRFRERQTSPLRSWKLSENDVKSIDKWDEYTMALEDIFAKTSHKAAPWYIVRTDDKKRGRIECIRHFLSLVDYPDKNKDLIANVDKNIVITVKSNSLEAVKKEITILQPNEEKEHKILMAVEKDKEEKKCKNKPKNSKKKKK